MRTTNDSECGMSDRSEPRAIRTGFTLVELLIVISIIGLLLGILLPAIGNARKSALDIVCASNQRSIGQAAFTWQTDHGGRLVGSPANSARDLLNNGLAGGGSDPAEDIAGDVTQPFDWAGALAGGYLTDGIPPKMRDERMAVLNGTAGSLEQGIQAQSGLGVLACPRNDNFSVPYLGSVMPEGIDGTKFQTQLSMSYTTSRDFLWTAGGGSPPWAREGFWGSDSGVMYYPGWSELYLPGGSNRSGHSQSYSPNINSVGNASKKIMLADGARYQIPGQALDHDVSSRGAYGVAFSDTGAWNVNNTRAYEEGRNASGEFWTAVSFRHGGNENTAQGNAVFFDGHVETGMTITEARDPALWLPSNSVVDTQAISEEWLARYETGDGGGAFYQRSYFRVP